MSDLVWLDGYSGETLDELIAMAKTHRIDSLIVVCDQALQRKAARDGLESLTDEERVVLAVEELEREVNSGGFTSFLLYSYSDWGATIVESLRRIGCPKTAEITERAMGSIALKNLTQTEIEDAVDRKNDERDKVIEACDSAFFDSLESIERGLFAFIQTNKQKIAL